ncbi:MAG: selenocysteine-specific translation elongation factor [Deltaproteobacteria bacterium]|nr:MAG: selenocysteine-specific translation elongation factor [Deltaproteobacteria bacterium]
MKQIILGTAGHIDHGKTSLIKAMTGTDTDRLKEEKLRGITIELGFASLDLPGGRCLGIVDVPGHEKFVKNMVAGATGLDLVMMVVAADEGIMPQTREHMEICSLLGVRHGIVAMTKIDMVDEEWLELVTDDIEQYMQGTFLENAPIVPVSSQSGQGIPELITILDDLVATLQERPATGLFRLPIDRVFTMKGFGTVITGTLISGSVRTGDAVMIYPAGITSKVRGIQVHNQSVDCATAGQRTAINFQGLDRSTVSRGQVLAAPQTLKSNYMVDIQVQYLKSCKKELKNRTRLRFHAGTSEILGNLVLLDRETLSPGDTTVAQIRLDTPVALVTNDRFVLRSYSPVRTVGGGVVLNPIPPKHKRFRQDVIDGLKGLVTGSPEEKISQHIRQTGYAGLTFSELRLTTGLKDKAIDQPLGLLLSRREVILLDREEKLYIHGDTIEQLCRSIHTALSQYHDDYPLKPGMQKEELRSKFPQVKNPKLLTLILNQMVRDGQLVEDEKIIRLAGHKVSLAADQSTIRKNILAAYADTGLMPPYFRELIKTLDTDAATARDVLDLMVQDHQLIKAKEDLYFHAGAVEELKQSLVAFLKEQGEITTPRFKEMTGVSRKYVIPLIEYFDSQNVTIRIGDIRKLRRG